MGEKNKQTNPHGETSGLKDDKDTTSSIEENASSRDHESEASSQVENCSAEHDLALENERNEDDSSGSALDADSDGENQSDTEENLEGVCSTEESTEELSAEKGFWVEEKQRGDSTNEANEFDSEEDIRDSTKITLEHIHQYAKGSEAEPPIITQPIHQFQYDKALEVFVKPKDYEKSLSNLHQSSKRIFIVYSGENSGKFTTSLQLVHAIRKRNLDKSLDEDKSGIYSIRLKRNAHPWAILDFLQSQNIDQKPFFILEDAFDDNPRLYDPFLKRHGDTVDELLRKKNAYLILTTQWRSDDLGALPFTRVNGEVTELEKIFDNHLSYYQKSYETRALREDVLIEAKKQWPELAPLLGSPMKINRFCHQLAETPPDRIDLKMLKDLAQEASRIDKRPPRDWFRKLSLNDKIYAMLVILLESVSRRILDTIYVLTLERLMESGVTNLKDPRHFGLEDLLATIHCSESEGEIVRFEDRAHEEETIRQVKNYHHLLWSLVDILLKVIDDYRDAEFWSLRRDLGAAIGRLGPYHKSKYQVVLIALATSPHKTVATVAGYAIAETVVTHKSDQNWSLDWLNSRARSGHPDLMWASASATWRVFESLCRGYEDMPDDMPAETRARQERCLDILEFICKNAGSFEERFIEDKRDELQRTHGNTNLSRLLLKSCFQWFMENLGGVLFALGRMASVNARLVTTRLIQWLRGEDEGLARQARLCITRLFQYLGRFEHEPPIKNAYEPLLDLVQPLLEHMDRDDLGVDAFLNGMGRWLRWDVWRKTIGQAFFDQMTQSSFSWINNMIWALSRTWMTQSEPQTLTLGQNLIRFGASLLGEPIFPRGKVQALLALDLSGPALSNRQALVLGRTMYPILCANSDVWVCGLGRPNHFENTSAKLEKPWKAPDYACATLLMPCIENQVTQLIYILNLIWEPIIDIEDASEAIWKDRVIVATPSQSLLFPEWASVFQIKGPIHLETISRIRDLVQEKMAHILADSNSELLSEYFGDVPPDARDLRRDIEKELEEISTPERIDRIQHISTLFINLYRCDPSQALVLANNLLEHDSQLCKQMGRAFGRLLFRISAHTGPFHHVELLELAPKLLACGDQQIVRTLLNAWWRWFERVARGEKLTGCFSPSGALWKTFAGELQRYHQHLSQDILAYWKNLACEGFTQTMETAGDNLKWILSLGATQGTGLAQEGECGVFIVDNRLHSLVKKAMTEFLDDLIEAIAEKHPDFVMIVYRMGHGRAVSILETEREHNAFGQPPFAPRLVAPILDSLSEIQVRFAFILCGGPVLDIGDEHPCRQNIHLLDFSEKTQVPFGVNHIHQSIKIKDLVETLCKPI